MMSAFSGISRRIVLPFLLGAIIILASFLVSKYPIDFSKLAKYGYIGVFLVSLLGSATLFFPVPHAATVFAGGILFNPIGVGIAGGVGGTIGEMVGYLVGLSGQVVGQESKWYPKIKHWVDRYGGITIFILALIPNPLFDLAGMTAGLTRYKISRFIVATLFGKTLRSLILSYLGFQFGS